jgi:hypothetical protein
MDKLLAVCFSGELYFKFAPFFAEKNINIRLAMTIQDALEMLSKESFSAAVVDITIFKIRI